MNEKELINLLNSGDEYNFVAMDDKFSRYDAFDTENGIMLEIKCRNKHYDDTLLERRKFDWNKKYALDNDLEFMYAVSMPYKSGHRIYLFDPINMEDCGEYDFKWKKQLNAGGYGGYTTVEMSDNTNPPELDNGIKVYSICFLILLFMIIPKSKTERHLVIII